jgi:hypothetical protein
MKLAEALSIRKDLQKRIQHLDKCIKSDVKKLLILFSCMLFLACECPYLDELDRAQLRKTTSSHLTADMLTGLWQCYYPMYVGNVEFKEVRMFSSGKADIIMEDVGGSAYYAETFKWRWDGNYITFTKGNTTYQFQVTDCIFPELFLRDSRGKYTWAWRRPEDCIK